MTSSQSAKGEPGTVEVPSAPTVHRLAGPSRVDRACVRDLRRDHHRADLAQAHRRWPHTPWALRSVDHQGPPGQSATVPTGLLPADYDCIDDANSKSAAPDSASFSHSRTALSAIDSYQPTRPY
jgi:hypothetical protein